MQRLQELIIPTQLMQAFSKDEIHLEDFNLVTFEHENPRFVIVKGNWKHHTYSFTMDERSGDLYNDFGKLHLYFANAALVIATPFLIVIDECLQAYRFVRLINPNDRTALKVEQFALDFLRLPAYRLAILAGHASALALGILKPVTLYDVRAFQAKMYRAMYRMHDQNDLEWPCCQINLSNLTVVGKSYRLDPATSDPQNGLNSLAEKIFRYAQIG